MSKSSLGFTVTFCGVRGVHPCSGPDYQEFGSDTICTHVHLQRTDAPPIHAIFDAGSGIISLGHRLITQKPAEVFLFCSHMHLDHIVGLPYFAPFWNKDWKINIFAGTLEKCDSATTYLRHHIAPPLFPIPFSDFPAQTSFYDIEAFQEMQFNGFSVNTFPLNHPGGGIGYRLNAHGKSVCHVTDTEHVPGSPDQVILKAIQDTDLMIYDSTYTDDTWEPKRGWGHSTWEEGIRLAKAARVKRLALYHHDHTHTDQILAHIDQCAQKEMPTAFLSRQNMVLEL